jgi:HD superfamily phosphodiesterase
MHISLINSLFDFVLLTTNKYKIDESHAIKHSMDVHYYALKIYENEWPLNPKLTKQSNVIFTSAIIHDMCDKKYMDEKEGINNVKDFLDNKLEDFEVNAVLDIISTMSYSTVKKKGFPELGEYQDAYHIVREADLLASYDLDRCIIYQMMKNNDNYEKSLHVAIDLFENRVLEYLDEKLFTTKYGKLLAKNLHINCIKKINTLRRLYKI